MVLLKKRDRPEHQEYIYAIGLAATCHHPARRLRESPDI
jgi:hypothetical protein